MSPKPAVRILEGLKAGGPQTAGELAEPLGVTAVAVRQQLVRLEEEGLVDSETIPRGVGRPRRVWSLTEAGHRTFADRHGDLSAELLAAMQTAFGADGLAQLIAARTRRQLADYRRRMPAASASIGKQVQALARIRSEEGYMATAERAGRGRWLLIENHCPICVAAKACAGLCSEELALFRKLLPSGVRIERTEHLLEGQRRCVYTVEAI